jgi:iron transport multicopper oxidase
MLTSSAFFNNKTYVQPKVPTLYSVLTTGSAATDVDIYGSNTNAFILEEGQVVELVVNSLDPGKHPFHLHGHAFQAVYRSDEDAGSYDPTNPNVTLASNPMRRDTFLVSPGGNIVLRFRADNPGVWLFHCHIEWHISSGLVATIIEAPLALQAQGIKIPADHIAACAAQGHPFTGNAAGNGGNTSILGANPGALAYDTNVYDLSGENVAVGPLPDGFTTRGIVALVFSCLSAFLGIIVIGWYGRGEITKVEEENLKLKVEVIAGHVVTDGKAIEMSGGVGGSENSSQGVFTK